MFFVKALLFLFLIGCSAFFLAEGLGATIPNVEYHGLIVRDAPIGLAFLAAGIAMLRFWKISESKTITDETRGDDGTVRKTTKVEVKRYFR
jgi:hypothetical protein